jgi:hypothetical protein
MLQTQRASNRQLLTGCRELTDRLQFFFLKKSTFYKTTFKNEEDIVKLNTDLVLELCLSFKNAKAIIKKTLHLAFSLAHHHSHCIETNCYCDRSKRQRDEQRQLKKNLQVTDDA